MGKTKKRKRIIAAACMIALLITGCGKGNAGEGEDGPQSLTAVEISGGAGEEGNGDGETGENGENGEGRGGDAGEAWDLEDGPITWQAAWFPLENAYSQVFSAGGKFYGLAREGGPTRLDIINKESLTVEGTALLENAAPDSGIGADKDGNLYVPARGEETGLWKIDLKGDSPNYEKIELEDCSDRNDPFLKGIETDSEGYTYIWCGMSVPKTEKADGMEREVWYMADRVYVKDGQMKTVFYHEILDASGVDVLCFQIDGEGRPCVLMKDQKDIMLQEIDVAAQKGKEPVKLGTAFDCFGMEDANIPEHLNFTGRGWLYCRENKLYEFRYDTCKKADILDLASYGLLSSDILFLGKGRDRMEIINRDVQSGSLELAVLTPGSSDKTIVTLGVVMVAQDLEAAVAQFNRDSAKYRVEIVDYLAREGNYEDAGEKLKLDMVPGKAPDVIATSAVDYRIFSGKGVLADLYGFMEGDGEISKDMLVQSVMKAFEEQGCLYSIAPSFQLHTMWGYADVTRGKSGVTFSELLRLLDDAGKDLNAIGGFAADEPVLTRLCCATVDEFVDWETGTCEFDGAYFREVLSFAKNYHPAPWEGGYFQGIRERKQVLTVGMISSVADYQLEKEVYGGNLAFIGYPAAEGSGTAVNFRSSAVAVNARSGDQAGAWEFVKYYLLQGYDGQGFPIVQKQFDEAMEAAMEDDYTEAADSGRRERLPKGTYTTGDDHILVYAASRQEVDAILELVKSARNRFDLHPVIQDIIDEEAEGYLSGQVDLDRTVDKIQNRVSLLLQESR